MYGVLTALVLVRVMVRGLIVEPSRVLLWPPPILPVIAFVSVLSSSSLSFVPSVVVVVVG